jgi:hypothetical protein
MRKIRRAQQRHARQNAKFRKKFQTSVLAAGTAAAITLGTGLGATKVLADDHQLPVARDADSDLLSNREEFSIGYRPFRPDQNRNQTRDGVELARRCAAVIAGLPSYLPEDPPPEPNGLYKLCHRFRGSEQCDVCGQDIHMGGCTIVNPKLNFTYPDASDPLDPLFLPDLAVHYMEHGSFDCYGEIHTGRVDVQRLLWVLELRFPYDPNEHQLPLDYVVESVGQLAPDANDTDGDLLADSEELKARYNLHDPDQDRDLTPDGIELAKQCVAVIDQLPIHNPYSGEPAPHTTYKIKWFERGLELCEICGGAVNMGYWEVVNPHLGLSLAVYDITCHYMGHGSFSFSGLNYDPPNEPFHCGRVDIALLARALEIPRRCRHLGRLYLPPDLNDDGSVNLRDVAELGARWLQCTDPNDPSCEQL